MVKKRGRPNLSNKLDLSKFEKFKIPFSIFRSPKLTVFEALVKYLKEECHLSYREISRLLNRDERNIWTVYNRAKRKNEKK